MPPVRRLRPRPRRPSPGSRRRRGLALDLGRLGALARPRLVELDAPLALGRLLEREAGTERAPGAALEARHRLRGLAGRDQLARDRHRQLLAGLALPDHEPAARVLARPARVALAVLDDVVAADGAGAEVRPRDADVLELGVELGDGRLGEVGDVAHEALARLLALLDLGQPALPVAGQARRGERVAVEQPDHVEALLGADERAAVALDVADVDQPLDDRGARRRRADAGVLHLLAQLVVVELLAGRLHRAQQRRVGVAPRRLGLLLGRGDLARVDALVALELRQRLVGALVVLVGARLAPGRDLAVGRAPAGLEQHAPAGAEDVLGDGRLEARVLPHRVGVEDGEEAPHDHVVDALVVVAHLLDAVLGARRDDRVVVGDLGVVDHAAERQHVEPGHVGGGLGVLAVRADAPGGRLDLADHVGGEEARVRARVGQRLVLLVEPLGGGERAAGREAVAVVGLALERGQVVEERRALLLRRRLELRDLAGLALDGGDDRVGLGGGGEARLGAGVVAALVGAALARPAVARTSRRRASTSRA